MSNSPQITEKTQIVLNKESLKQWVCSHFNLDPENTKMDISYYNGDQRQSESLEITFTGEKSKTIPARITIKNDF